MRSDEMLEHALQGAGLPVRAYEYRGAQQAYLVYNEEDERCVAYRDDCPGAVSLWWQVHLFMPKSGDYRGMKRKIRALLLGAGFGVGAVRTLYERETETVHVVLSCTITEKMED